MNFNKQFKPIIIERIELNWVNNYILVRNDPYYGNFAYTLMLLTYAMINNDFFLFFKLYYIRNWCTLRIDIRRTYLSTASRGDANLCTTSVPDYIWSGYYLWLVLVMLM